MCLLKYFWKNEKKKNEDFDSKNFLSTFLNYVTHQCCMKTLVILALLVLVFCLIGNPQNGREGKVVDQETDHVVSVLNWLEETEHLTRTERTILETNNLVRTSKVLDQCYCDNNKRRVSHVSKPITNDFLNSTCDWFATARGPGQRVVSYSFYGDLRQNPEVGRKYFNEIGARAEEVKSFYPGWLMRLYYQVDPEDVKGIEHLCKLWCEHDHLDLCDVTDLPQPLNNLNELQPIGRTWRFAVMMDPLVDVFISRDLDSSILSREVSAVNNWLDVNRTYHIMRDHPSHNGYIMAGLWGAKNSADRDKISDLGSTLFHSKPRKYWDFDQALLRRIVWPEAVRSVLQHDAYSCKYNKFNQFHPVMPFPARREGLLYTGWGPVKTSPNRTGIVTCPKNCRPPDHPDWVTC